MVDGGGITITEAAIPGRHIRPAGVDFRKGDVLLTGGTRLTDRDLSLAASMNYPELAGAAPAEGRDARHRRRTGDAGLDPGPGQIVYSNGYALRALARAGGRRDHRSRHCRRHRRGHHGRHPPRPRLGADILITTGGASVGDHDLVKQSLEAEGVAMAFWRIAMRPGKPMMHGRLGGMRVIGLPGNPVSSYVCGFLFLVPLIRALSGRAVVHHARETALLGRDVAANDLREDYLRARLELGARRRPDRHDGRPSGQLAVGKSRCGTGACDPCAVCARRSRRLALRASCGCRADLLKPVPAACRRRNHSVDEKLSGCGTHMEHIVFVHDLFRALMPANGDLWLAASESGVSESNGTIGFGTRTWDDKLGDWSRCSRANNMNCCDSSANV